MLQKKKQMKVNKRYWFNVTIFGVLTSLFLLISTCERSNQRGSESGEDETTGTQGIKGVAVDISAEKATFFLDNSGGMFGYVDSSSAVEGSNDFILAVSKLALNSRLSRDNVEVDYNLINGPRNIEITPIGSNAGDFRDCLNPTCLDQGSPSGNDFNAVFQIALENAGSKELSLFISDGIYDVQDKTNPLTALRSEGLETRNKFINRLVNEDIQTLVIKLESNFSGRYSFGVTNGSVKINQYRPFYVFVFGNSDLLNNYFNDDYVEDLDGYVNHTRFFLPTDYQINYEPSTAYNKKGDFKKDRNDPKRLTNASRNQNGEFEFSVGVDYSSLPLSDNYLTNVDHYEVTGHFEVLSVEKYRPAMYAAIPSFEPSHMITLRATGLPQGIIDIKLLNEVPAWMEESHTDDDRSIEGDSTTTFGFKYLIEGIVDAYSKVSKQDYFTIKTVTLSRN